MESKSVVTVCRKWNSPNILVWVNDEEIGMGMKLDDFIIGLAAEMGNPTFMVTAAQLLSRMKAAQLVVEGKMKEASAVAV
jgi:hypothetical protein